MFFVVRSNDSFNFPLGLIKYIVIVVIVINVLSCTPTGVSEINYLTLIKARRQQWPHGATLHEQLREPSENHILHKNHSYGATRTF